MSSPGCEHVTRDQPQVPPARPNYKSNKHFVAHSENVCAEALRAATRFVVPTSAAHSNALQTAGHAGEVRRTRTGTCADTSCFVHVAYRHTVSITLHSVA